MTERKRKQLQEYYDYYNSHIHKYDEISDLISDMAKAFQMSVRNMWRKKDAWESAFENKETTPKQYKLKPKKTKETPETPVKPKQEKEIIPKHNTAKEIIEGKKKPPPAKSPKKVVLDLNKINDNIDEITLGRVIDLLINGATLEDIKSYFANPVIKISEVKNHTHSFSNSTQEQYIYLARETIVNNTFSDLKFSRALKIQQIKLIYKKSLASKNYNAALKAIVTQDDFEDKLIRLEEAERESNKPRTIEEIRKRRKLVEKRLKENQNA